MGLNQLPPGACVRMTPAGIDRDTWGNVNRVRIGVVVGYAGGWLRVQRDGQYAVGSYYPDSW